jgi:hypothetical protein
VTSQAKFIDPFYPKPVNLIVWCISGVKIWWATFIKTTTQIGVSNLPTGFISSEIKVMLPHRLAKSSNNELENRKTRFYLFSK